MKRNIILSWIFLFCIFFQTPVFAATIPIDLNSFLTDDPTMVTIDSGGTEATITNSVPFYSVFLYNDSIIDLATETPTSLDFDYLFTEPIGSDYEFFAFIYDTNDYDPLNPVREFSANSSQSGPVSWSLAGLDPSILSLGLEFQLNTNDAASSDGQVTISNVRYDTYVIPEPGSVFLFGLGLIACAMGTRRIRES